MRKSNIKSVMHWSIMGLIFGAPIVATLGSLIPKNYENMNNYVYSKTNDLVLGQSYRVMLGGFVFDNEYHYLTGYNLDNQFVELRVFTGWSTLIVNGVSTTDPSGYVDINFNGVTRGNEDYFLPYVYEAMPYVNYDIGYKTYLSLLDFKNLSINNWYNTMLNLTVGQPTGYDVISVLKMYPLFAIWVVVLDLMYDCMCFIPTMCHHWLHKIEGEEE